MAPIGALDAGDRSADNMPARARDPHSRHLVFAYDADDRPVLDDLDLTIPAGTSLAIVGQNGAGKTTLAKLLCRLYDPQSGAIEVDGVDVREFDLESWRARVTAVFQDFIRYESPLRDNVAPAGAPDDDIGTALAEAGAADLADLDTILARGYPGGIDLSGGQWQRVTLPRVRCARCGSAPVSSCSTSRRPSSTCAAKPRSSTGSWRRHAFVHDHPDLTSVLHRASRGSHLRARTRTRSVELGTHDELMARQGRYRTMFDLQASRFGAEETREADERGESYDVLS